MHTSVIQSPQAMSNDQSYRPRSPDLPGFAEPEQYQTQQPPLRLNRLPSYQIEEPSLPKGYSFSPRGSYDASPFFSQTPSQQGSGHYFGPHQGNPYPDQSPPRFTPASIPDQPQVFSPVSYTQSPQRHQLINPFQKSPSPFQPLQRHLEQPLPQSIDEMARLRSRKPVNYNEDHNGAQYEEPLPVFSHPQSIQQMPQQPQQLQPPQQPPPLPMPSHPISHPMPHQFAQQPMHLGAPMQAPIQPPHLQPSGPPMPAVDVRTKFPVARIKRIMQADEDVGKVAQATPTAVSKALELFMIALVTKGAVEAKNNNSKRVTATHLKHALLTDPQFDFLNEICEAVPDEGGKGSKGRAKSEAKSEDSDEEMAGPSKKKGKGGRKKKAGDDDGSD